MEKKKMETRGTFVNINFYSLCLSAKATLSYLADKEDTAGMILWGIQKFVTKRVTQLLEKHLAVAKPYIENAVVIFCVRSHKSPILENASLPSRTWAKR